MSETTTPPAGEQQQSQSSAKDMIPKARFDEVIQQRNEMRERLDKLDAEAEARRQADLESKGKYDELKAGFEKTIADLTAERDSLKASSTKLAEIQKAQREAQIAGLPEDRREFAGSLNDEQLAVYVKTHKNKGVHIASDKPGGGAGARLTMAEYRKLPREQQTAEAWSQVQADYAQN